MFVYKSAYLRICGHHYDIKLFEDGPRHLSNYSIQKVQADEEEDNSHEFVMSSQEFVERLNGESESKKTWEKTFYPQIKQITTDVFNRMREVMDHHPNCFELYGLDFVID